MDNKKISNKIITISGEPVSGKGTTVKKIKEQLLKSGYKEENIHFESTGHDFRDYFNYALDLMKLDDTSSLENKSNLKFDLFKNAVNETKKILEQNNVEIRDFSIEEANNSEYFEILRQEIDKIIDIGMQEKGKKINSTERPDEIWIIDSRLAFSNIPDSFSVRLTANPKVAGERLFNDKARGKEDNEYKSVEEAIEQRESRKIGEKNRYIEKYGIDITNEDNYDLIIDTSYSDPDEIAQVILKCHECYKANKPFTKKWASPKIFLPLQSERDTYAFGSLMTFEEIVESIEKYGYYPEAAIEIISVDDIKYIIEGHHRNFASAYVGNTLVPYEIVAKDDEELPKSQNTARQRIKGVSINDLYGHEQFLDDKKKGIAFSYNQIYPDIYNKLQNREDEAR